MFENYVLSLAKIKMQFIFRIYRNKNIENLPKCDNEIMENGILHVTHNIDKVVQDSVYYKKAL